MNIHIKRGMAVQAATYERKIKITYNKFSHALTSFWAHVLAETKRGDPLRTYSLFIFGSLSRNPYLLTTNNKKLIIEQCKPWKFTQKFFLWFTSTVLWAKPCLRKIAIFDWGFPSTKNQKNKNFTAGDKLDSIFTSNPKVVVLIPRVENSNSPPGMPFGCDEVLSRGAPFSCTQVSFFILGMPARFLLYGDNLQTHIFMLYFLHSPLIPSWFS